MHNRSSPSPRAKKSLGQHFLHRADICARIASLLDLHKEDRLLEIGPGPGALTQVLEKSPHNLLLLLEKDNYWVAERGRLKAAKTLPIHTDALRFDWRRIRPESPWKIVGNLPYNIASRLIWDIVEKAQGCSKAVFMVQYEVGRRITALPGNRLFGALSVWVQAFTRPHLEFIVPREAFSPPPKVLSAVLSLEPLSQHIQPEYAEKLACLLRICFQQRRKQLGVIFRQIGKPELATALKNLNIDPLRRPETLTTENFLQLCTVL